MPNSRGTGLKYLIFHQIFTLPEVELQICEQHLHFDMLQLINVSCEKNIIWVMNKLYM